MTEKNDKISVLILDDQLVQREGISRVLESSKSMRIAGIASTSDEALELLESEVFDLALVDLVLKNEQGTDVGRAMRKIQPDLKVIIYTREKSMVLAAEIIKKSKETSEPGLHGYILTRKISSSHYLLEVYEQILQTGYYIDSDVLRWHYRLEELDPLTTRERECAILVARGMSNSEIANRMIISLRRVENLINALYLKFRILGDPGDPGRRVLLAEGIKLLYGNRLSTQYLKFLVIEDQEFQRTRLLREFTTSGQFEFIAEANTGQKGIELAVEIKPDIILTDVHLPDIDGFQVIRKILHALPQTKIIVMSSDPSSTYTSEAIHAGALGFLPKNQVTIDNIMKLCYPIRY
jgi:DNA-binding NarL/FixJ family response regulator